MPGFLDSFRPDERVGSVTDIDCRDLKASGIDCMMLDLDNTLLPWKSSRVPALIAEWVEGAKQAGMRLAIVSNTHNPGRLARIAKELGIPWLHRALKPRRSGFARAAAMMESEWARTVVVGDQLLTDILGGNLAGMRTILVEPMDSREFVGTRISRLIERGIMAMLGRAGAGTKSKPIQSETQDTK